MPRAGFGPALGTLPKCLPLRWATSASLSGSPAVCSLLSKSPHRWRLFMAAGSALPKSHGGLPSPFVRNQRPVSSRLTWPALSSPTSAKCTERPGLLSPNGWPFETASFASSCVNCLLPSPSNPRIRLPKVCAGRRSPDRTTIVPVFGGVCTLLNRSCSACRSAPTVARWASRPSNFDMSAALWRSRSSRRSRKSLRMSRIGRMLPDLSYSSQDPLLPVHAGQKDHT